MLTTIRTWRRRHAHRRAERDQALADHAAAHWAFDTNLADLRTARDPIVRANRYGAMAYAQWLISRASAVAYPGPDPVGDHGMHATEVLLWMLADVERAVHYGTAREWSDEVARESGCPVGPAVDAVLERMAGIPDLAGRLALLDELYAVAVPVVGGQAAEVLRHIPGPNLEGGDDA